MGALKNGLWRESQYGQVNVQWYTNGQLKGKSIQITEDKTNIQK